MFNSPLGCRGTRCRLASRGLNRALCGLEPLQNSAKAARLGTAPALRGRLAGADHVTVTVAPRANHTINAARPAPAILIKVKLAPLRPFQICCDGPAPGGALWIASRAL